MKVSYNSLKEILDFDLSPEALAEVLTDTGLEIEGIQTYNGLGNGMEGLVVAKVESLEAHPDADKLQVAQVDAGLGELLQIVCGAPNIAVGQKVILATVNTVLYPEKGEAFKIKKSKIRGVESFGMICAEDEIGLGEGHAGIKILEDSVPIGKSIAEHFGIKKDSILEIGLTPNRSDALGHIGVARDIAAALSFHNKEEYNLKPLADCGRLTINNKECPVEVVLEDTKACPRYSGVVLEGLKVEESPVWLRQKLLALGVRPINNIVDITNLVLHEFGQPLHAFDMRAVKGNKIIVKTLAQDSLFTTLDEVERKLHSNDLMICNAEEAMCIAGVFGGIKSGVKTDTQSIFIESAHFEAIGIRKTANRHLLRTDAAQKYEKSTDPEITLKALARAIQLISEIAGGKINGTVCDYYPTKIERAKVDLEFSYLNKILGVEIEKDAVKSILQKLDIEIVIEKKDLLSLSVPAYRADVKRPADIAEEIIRIYGLNNILISDRMTASLSYTQKPDADALQRKLSEFFRGKGFNEMVNNSITQSAYYQKLKSTDEPYLVKVLKSSNSELDTLRSNMLYPVLERMAFNLNRKNKNLKFFEFGQVYAQKEVLEFTEKAHLILAACGNVNEESWVQDELNIDFYYLKPLLQHVLDYLPNQCNVVPLENDANYALGLEYLLEGKNIAKLGLINEDVCDFFGIDTPIVVADINWSAIREFLVESVVQFKDLPKYPAVRRDLALLVNKEISFAEIEQIANEEAKPLLKRVNLFDIYADKKLGDNKKSYAVSFLFRDNKKTLTDKAIDRLMTNLIKRYETELSAQLRN